MPTYAEYLRIGSFASKFGDRERVPESIEGFDEICSARGLNLSLLSMGCGTFWQMTEPIESYITKCVSETLSASGVAAKCLNHIVFATVDKSVRYLDQDFARNILDYLGLVNCVPTLISMQQCVSSLAALNHACALFADATVNHVIVVAFDFVVDDSDRIQPFALFGDAVTSCMITRGNAAGLSLLSYGVNVDFAGLLGRDDFQSRKKVAEISLERVLKEGNARIEDVERCFTTNLFKPLALFNASSSGIHSSKLCIDTLKSRAHCGNCDWMMNLNHYGQYAGFVRGQKYLVQSYAPGFFACGLLESSGDGNSAVQHSAR